MALKLDFSIENINDRKIFIDEYLKTNKNLTNKELETIANYILWGKDDNGQNLTNINLETAWTKKGKLESLEGLLENPNFDENIFFKKPVKAIKKNFDRSKIYNEAPQELIPDFEKLFAQIDKTDILINYYEIFIGKRKKPPREELLKKFTQEELSYFQKEAQALTQRKYLQLRKLLIELRATQYTLRDFYCTTRYSSTLPQAHPNTDSFILPQDLTIRPLGTKKDNKNIFFLQEELKDIHFSEEALKKILIYYWKNHDELNEKADYYFDFRDKEHVYKLICAYPELQKEPQANDLLETFDYYIKLARLTPIQLDTLYLKMQGETNPEIARIINKKYGSKYLFNYISTIFKKQILTALTKAAEFHCTLVENFCYPENFKTCSVCGAYLLKDPYNYVRKANSGSGYTGRCKKCDSEKRRKIKRW